MVYGIALITQSPINLHHLIYLKQLYLTENQNMYKTITYTANLLSRKHYRRF